MKKRIIYFLSLIITGVTAVMMNSCKEDELFTIEEVQITWENPADVIDGVALSVKELNATANVPGTMVFTPPLGTVLAKGDNQTLKADFTPRDSKYPGLSKTVTVNVVDKLIPVITWDNPDVLAEGTPLDSIQLNATADVEGTFVYTPAAGTVLSLGENQELKVDFTPSVITHQPTSKIVLINVRDVVPLSIVDNSALWTGAQSLAFDIRGEVGSLGDHPETGFVVHVFNESKSVDREFEITEVSFDAANTSRIEIKLANEIYADDIISISFSKEGNTIKSIDEQILKSFDAQQVAIPVTGDDLLAGNSWAGFEGTGGANAAGAAGYWVGSAEPWQRTTDMFVSGEASMKYTGGFDVNPLYGMNFGNNVDIEPGAFEITHMVYIESGSNLKAIRTAIARKSNGWADDVQTVWDVENIARGEWVAIRQIINIPVAINAIDPNEKMRYTYYIEASLNEGVLGDQTFYLDDMGIKKVDVPVRP